jgi:hypothetical protein
MDCGLLAVIPSRPVHDYRITGDMLIPNLRGRYDLFPPCKRLISVPTGPYSPLLPHLMFSRATAIFLQTTHFSHILYEQSFSFLGSFQPWIRRQGFLRNVRTRVKLHDKTTVLTSKCLAVTPHFNHWPEDISWNTAGRHVSYVCKT